jgi:hypothetical protein
MECKIQARPVTYALHHVAEVTYSCPVYQCVPRQLAGRSQCDVMKTSHRDGETFWLVTRLQITYKDNYLVIGNGHSSTYSVQGLSYSLSTWSDGCCLNCNTAKQMQPTAVMLARRNFMYSFFRLFLLHSLLSSIPFFCHLFVVSLFLFYFSFDVFQLQI